LTVEKDWHQTLREPDELKAQIAVAREQATERELAQALIRERELDRGLER